MPMGIISDEDFSSELTKFGLVKESHEKPPEKLLEIPTSEDPAIVEEIKRGRGVDTGEIPSEIRALAASSAINGESARSVASAFGISESSVSAYKVGAHSTSSYHEPDGKLLEHVTGHRERISKKARSRLLAALNELTPTKLAGVKPRDLAAIARDMSTIVADMEPPTTASQTNQVQFVFMAPRIRQLDEFKVIDVNE